MGLPDKPSVLFPGSSSGNYAEFTIYNYNFTKSNYNYFTITGTGIMKLVSAVTQDIAVWRRQEQLPHSIKLDPFP